MKLYSYYQTCPSVNKQLLLLFLAILSFHGWEQLESPHGCIWVSLGVLTRVGVCVCARTLASQMPLLQSVSVTKHFLEFMGSGIEVLPQFLPPLTLALPVRKQMTAPFGQRQSQECSACLKKVFSRHPLRQSWRPSSWYMLHSHGVFSHGFSKDWSFYHQTDIYLSLSLPIDSYQDKLILACIFFQIGEIRSKFIPIPDQLCWKALLFCLFLNATKKDILRHGEY